MNPKKLAASAIAICCASALLAGAASAAAEIEWITDRSTAYAAAAESGKPLLVDLWAVWCAPCKVMDETTWSDSRVVAAASGFVPLKLDIDANEIFVERFEVAGFPTTLFLDEHGDEITRVSNLVEADEMLSMLARVGAGYPSYVDNAARAEDPGALRDAAAFLEEVDNPRGAVDLLRQAAKSAREQGDGEPAESIELELGRAMLSAEMTGAAAKVLRRLSDDAATDEVRGEALLELVRAERARERNAKADQALARLRSEFPELASRLDETR
jgi:thioredoxin-like negative regulator of GroEL